MIGISPFAAKYVRRRAVDRMDDVCRIWKPGELILDRTTGKTSRGEAILKYQGYCRFWEVTSGQQVLVGDEQIVVTQSFLSLPFDAPIPESDDIVRILQSADFDLIGRTVSVVSVVRGGGLRASRRFLVQVQDSKKDTW